MAIKSCLIIAIAIYEVTSYIHPYASKPLYPKGPRPREISYVVDPNRLQQSYASPYPYPVQEAPAHYPVYQNPTQQPNYQLVQQVIESSPVNYPIFPQPVEPKPVVHPVYQPVEAVAEIQAVPALTPAAPILPSNNDKPAGFDSNVLNNLAIALQLLIINNLMNNPAPNCPGIDAIKNAIEGAKVAVNKPCDTEYPAFLNAKFLGSSNFDDASSIIGYGSPSPSPRVGALLRSPYDYLTSSSSSEYPTSTSNFQNPYAAIFSPDNIKDLFMMSDYY